MEGKTGMELAKQLRGWDEDVSLLFITSSSDFLKDGYAVRPIQYLFKPVRRAELADALGTDLRLHHTPETVSIHTKTGVFSLPLRALRYIESQDHMAVACLPEGPVLTASTYPSWSGCCRRGYSAAAIAASW